MAKLTQGTHIFFIDPDDESVVRLTKVDAGNPGGDPADQIDVTSLESFSKEFVAGLRTPAQATFGINADPGEESHVRAYELSRENPAPVIKWAIGWSDGTAPPTVDSNGEWVLPTTRTWFTFLGYVADFPFDFATNSVVKTTIAIQRSGDSTWTPKA